MADVRRALEEQAARRELAQARAAEPVARLICLIDRRSSSAAAKRTRILIAIPPSSAWHDLIADEQIVEICDRGSSAI